MLETFEFISGDRARRTVNLRIRVSYIPNYKLTGGGRPEQARPRLSVRRQLSVFTVLDVTHTHLRNTQTETTVSTAIRLPQ